MSAATSVGGGISSGTSFGTSSTRSASVATALNTGAAACAAEARRCRASRSASPPPRSTDSSPARSPGTIRCTCGCSAWWRSRRSAPTRSCRPPSTLPAARAVPVPVQHHAFHHLPHRDRGFRLDDADRRRRAEPSRPPFFSTSRGLTSSPPFATTEPACASCTRGDADFLAHRDRRQRRRAPALQLAQLARRIRRAAWMPVFCPKPNLRT